MSVYRVTARLPKGNDGTVIVEAANREQAKDRALNQLRSMGHVVGLGDVWLCRKDKTRATGNRPTPTNGGKPA